MGIDQFVLRITDTTITFILHTETGIERSQYDMNRGMAVAANLRQALDTCTLKRKASQEVLVRIDVPVLLIPQDDYHFPAMEQYKLVYPNQENTQECSTSLPALKTVAVFAVSKDLYTVLNDQFNIVHLEPLMTRLWEQLMRHSERQNNTSKTLYVYPHDERIEICAFQRRRFIFANTFDATNTDDSAYYILAAWQQCHLTVDKDYLCLVNIQHNQDKLVNTLKQYIQHIININLDESGDRQI